MVRVRLGFVLLFAFTFAAIGCKQSAGDRCQLDSDCEDGLICRYVGMPNLEEGGQCQLPQTGNDGQVVTDGPSDAGVDAATDGATDALGDDAAVDGATDAAVDAPSDAGTDA